MGSGSDFYKVVVLDKSAWTVVRTDPARPRFMEVIANFYDEKRARDYAESQNEESGEPEEQPEPKAEPRVERAPAPKPSAAPVKPAPARKSPKPEASEGELSSRQSAVLRALREKMDESRQVALKAAVLAQAAQIPLGSLHSVLGSLEKKGLIEAARPGSARSPAVYRVL